MARRRRQAAAEEDDLPSEDEVQLFHRSRSKRLVEASRQGLDERSRRRAAVSDSDESSEEEGSEIDEVIGLTGAEEEDEDEDEEEEEEQDEVDDDDDTDTDDDDEEEGDDTDPHATKGWGVSKNNFYSGEEADSSDSDAEDGTGALEEEEAEARRLQRQRTQKLRADDFGDVSSQEEETLGAAATRAGKRVNNTARGKQKHEDHDGLGAFEDDADVEEVSKDLSSMSREEKLQVLMSDAPELVELLSGFKESIGQIRTQIAPLVQQVKDGKLPTSSGSSFLEVKFHLLLSYCINITFYLLLKARGQTVQDHPVIESLVKLRALIEKCGPIDLKLKYQIEKLIAAAANSSGSGSDAALSHKPRPDALMGAGEDNGDGGEEDTEGRSGAAALYQVPKLSATRYDDGREESNFERKAAARRARLLKTDMVKTMQAELSDAPVEKYATDPSRLRGEAAQAAKEAEERRVYEENNFVRLTLSKKDKANEKLRARAERGMLEDEFSSFNTEEFGELASLVSAEAEAANEAAKRSEREQKKRRTLARYLNDIEQKERKVTKRGAASADTDLPWDAPEQKQPKRKKPDYNVHDDSDDEPPEAVHVEDEAYTAAIEKRQNKKQQKKERRELAAAEHAEAREMQEGKHTGGKRGATRDIIKNKGLTPHRNKLERNPRVKKKVKYAKKVKKARSSGLSGRQNTSVGGASGYAGESTGINPKVSRSTRIA